MKLIYYSKDSSFDEELTDKLRENEVTLEEVDLDRLVNVRTEEYDGILAHPGLQLQREFCKHMERHMQTNPNLKIATFSYGVEDYHKMSGRIKMFDIKNYRGIIEYFSKSD